MRHAPGREDPTLDDPKRVRQTRILIGPVAVVCFSAHEVLIPMTTLAEVLKAHHEDPIEQSIGPVVDALAERKLLVPLATTPIEDGKSLDFLVAFDVNEEPWVYVYSDTDELTRALPGGAPCAMLTCPELVAFLSINGAIRGVLLDSASSFSYPIPREMFDRLANI